MQNRRIQEVYIECEVLKGLKSFALQEIKREFGKSINFVTDRDEESVKFFFIGDLAQLLHLRTVTAVYAGVNLKITGPSALLLQHNFRTVVSLVRLAQSLHSKSSFQSFRISSAGSDSLVFRRLASQLRTKTGLKEYEDGDLLLRVRPTEFAKWGWDVLVRLSPRPLSARSWRVENMPGAVNACVASALLLQMHPQPKDVFCNLMCGSGTLLIERLLLGPVQECVGVDISTENLAKARRNLESGKLLKQVNLIQADATTSPLPSNHFTKLVVDLPWGQLVGTHSENASLYPMILQEASRIAKQGADFSVLTHDLQLFEQALKQTENVWRLVSTTQVSQGGKHPKIFLLRKV